MSLGQTGTTDEPTQTSPEAPTRGFGLATTTFLVVASMVGTGVLTTSGFTVLAVESNALMLALWVVGGLVALCGALTIAELAAMLPRTGGDYVFLYEAFGPLAAFLSGWVSFLLGFGGPIAVSAYATAKYLLAPLGMGDEAGRLPQLALATALILALAGMHMLGRRSSVGLQGTTTVIKIAILGALALLGWIVGWGRWENLTDLPEFSAPRLRDSFYSLVYISYAYTGWNAAGYIAGEVEQPGRRVPRAILLGTAGVTLLYLALNGFFALALSPGDVERIAQEEGRNAVAPIAFHASSALLGRQWSGLLSVAVGLTLLASLSAFILTGPRVAFAMARAGQFPAIAGRLSKRTGTPVVATALQVAWALVLLWTGSFENIFIYSSIGLALISMLSISSVFVLRVRRPELPRPFRTPGYPVVPAIYLLITLLFALAAFQESPIPSTLSLLSILVGVPIYYLFLARRPPSETGQQPPAP